MKTKRNTSASLLFGIALAATAFHVDAANSGTHWIATWSASPQPVWGADFIFPTNIPEALNDQTLRQVARISLGGARLRLVLSNTYGEQTINIGKASVALSGTRDHIVSGSMRKVTFGGKESASLAPGASLASDAIELSVPALTRLSVSLYLPQSTPVSTFHWDGRETGWIVDGDQTSAAEFDTQEAAIHTTTARILLTDIDVAADAQTIVVIGDSITDGATASLDKDTRWPDFLAARLADKGIAVVNAGISGGRLLSDGMGASAQARLVRDALTRPGVSSVIIMLGINDIAWPGTAFAPASPRPTLDEMIAGYQQLITQAHAHGVRAIGVTLTPFEGALPDTPLDNYYQPEKDALRQKLNHWIRNSGAFDAVLDFDLTLRDPENPLRIHPHFDSGDHLHPSDAGSRAMADAVDLQTLIPQAGTTNTATRTNAEER